MEAIALAMKNWLNRSLPEKATERRKVFQRLRQLRLIDYHSDEELETTEAWLRIHPMIVDFVSTDAIDAASGAADAGGVAVLEVWRWLEVSRTARVPAMARTGRTPQRRVAGVTMFLKKFVFVNWGNVPNCEFDIGPVSLFSGANSSGKTTAADAIQTVMTAAHENLYHYNPGQDESTQRGRGKRVRTLASYVLGCDDGSYARTEATDGYIAAIFHPTQQETAEVFTAVVGVRAWLDRSGKQALAQEDQSLFLILPGVELGIDDFIKSREGVSHVTQLDEIQAQLVARLGKRVVEQYPQKRAYLRRLYGALRGKNDSVSEREALAAARAFSRFMAYKPVSSINQFVADEVLDRKDLGEAVRSVSSQLKTIHGMEREAQDLKDSAELLEKAGHHAQSYIETWIDLRTLGCTIAGAELLAWETQHRKKVAERECDTAGTRLDGQSAGTRRTTPHAAAGCRHQPGGAAPRHPGAAAQGCAREGTRCRQCEVHPYRRGVAGPRPEGATQSKRGTRADGVADAAVGERRPAGREHAGVTNAVAQGAGDGAARRPRPAALLANGPDERSGASRTSPRSGADRAAQP